MKFIIKVDVETDSLDAAQQLLSALVKCAEEFSRSQPTAKGFFGDLEPICDERHAALVELARDTYAITSNDLIEVDEDARTSEGDDGIFVQGWLFLANDKLAASGLLADVGEDGEGAEDDPD